VRKDCTAASAPEEHQLWRRRVGRLAIVGIAITIIGPAFKALVRAAVGLNRSGTSKATKRVKS